MRIAFTIIYNGLHHLQHKGFSQFMTDNFDLWVVVEGHARPGGSTRWCKKIPVLPRSDDGTHEFMTDMAATNPNVLYYSHGRYWSSKDDQVNKAIQIIRGITNKGYLWQVDVDEHWTADNLARAERYADGSDYTGFAFQFNQFVGVTDDGRQMVATGEWGSGYHNRLWKWRGQLFRSHEPPMLLLQRAVAKVPGVRYDHYSYQFKQDVKFKSMYYTGHEHIFPNWQALPSCRDWPQPISALFGQSKIGTSKSYINVTSK